MTYAERLSNGNIRAMVRLETGDTIGDGIVELKPSDPDYAAWDEYLGGGAKEAKALDLKAWEAKALHDIERKGRVYRPFESDVIPADTHARISAALADADSVEAVKAAFKRDSTDTLLDSVDADARKWASEAMG